MQLYGPFYVENIQQIVLMPKVTFPQKRTPNQQNAPKKCIDFVLNYSKSYHVLPVGSNKVGVTLN
jgi:hypothetical protein